MTDDAVTTTLKAEPATAADESGDGGAVFGETSGLKGLSYKSHSIFGRRLRILHEARILIEKRGHENFTLRELAQRAGVAQATLYNAFGSRGNIIVSAIQQYYLDYLQGTSFENSAFTLLGRIERIISAHAFNLSIRPYVSAIVAIYNAPGPDLTMRQGIFKALTQPCREYADYLSATKQFAPNLNPEMFREHLTQSYFALLSSWSYGEISDDDVGEALVESLLMIIYGSTKGPLKREAGEWLQVVRDRGQPWRDLKVRFGQRSIQA